jgi:hypothetical protein
MLEKMKVFETRNPRIKQTSRRKLVSRRNETKEETTFCSFSKNIKIEEG